jgi:hypothetical protein
MIKFLSDLSGQTDYGVRLYIGAVQEGARLLMVETLPRQYEVEPTGFKAGVYTVVIDKNGIEVGRAEYEWDGRQQITNTVINTSLKTLMSIAQSSSHRSHSSVQIRC